MGEEDGLFGFDNKVFSLELMRKDLEIVIVFWEFISINFRELGIEEIKRD